jgi:hypothetical protein
VVTRRRRVGQAIAALSVVLAVVVVLVVDQSSRSANRSIVANPGPNQSTNSTPVPNFSPEQIDALLTPITPEDWLDGTRSLFDFQGRADNALVQNCAAARGYPGSMGSSTARTIGDMHSSFQYFDSPALMRQFGYGVIADSVPGPDPGSSLADETLAMAPPTEVRDACFAEAHDAEARLLKLLNVFYDWTMHIQQLEASDDTMAQAWQTWGACMSDAGYDVANGPPVPNVNEGGDSKFRSLMTNAMRAPGANAAAVEVDLATIDANCLERTVVPARTLVRTPTRAQFIADHADAFRAAEADLTSVIQELSDKAGIGYARH